MHSFHVWLKVYFGHDAATFCLVRWGPCRGIQKYSHLGIGESTLTPRTRVVNWIFWSDFDWKGSRICFVANNNLRRVIRIEKVTFWDNPSPSSLLIFYLVNIKETLLRKSEENSRCLRFLADRIIIFDYALEADRITIYRQTWVFWNE